MDNESIAKAVILAVMLMSVWLVTSLIRRLWRSPTEGARRTKLVIAGLAVLAVSAVLISGLGVAGFLVTLVVLGTVAWVYKGYKK